MPPIPGIFGIVNISSDSFSDGGRYLDPGLAIRHAHRLLQDGAAVIDLGAAASNPDADHVPADIEIGRLAPVVAAIEDRNRISIDTFSGATQRWAIGQGVGWINDILGFADESLYPELASAYCRLVVMHNVAPRGRAEHLHTEPATIFDRLHAFFDTRIAALKGAGVMHDRIILDPGMGFFLGTDPEVSLTVLRGLKSLRQRYGLPVLVSVSRKSFIRRLAGVDIAASGAATLAAELYAAAQGVDFIRTHDVAALRQALAVHASLAGHPDD